MGTLDAQDPALVAMQTASRHDGLGNPTTPHPERKKIGLPRAPKFAASQLGQPSAR
jgi:hypothetical protein